MREYQPNSHRSKEEKAEASKEERKIQRVINSGAKTRENKKRKLTDIFVSEDVNSVGSHIFMDVIVPACKKLIYDIVTDGIDRVLYGENGSKRNTVSSGKVSYRSYYDDRHRDYRDSGASSGPKMRFDYDDVLLETMGQAETLRREMIGVIDRYGFVTVADMYDMAGLTAPYTSSKYGWTNIDSSKPVRVRDGYILELPKAVPID